MNPFFPKYEYPSAYEIPYEELFKRGISGIVFDIDNTLVFPDAPADDRSRKMFLNLKKMGFRICILSNNKEKRVRDFAAAVGSDYVSNAAKPSRSGYLRALKVLNLPPDRCISIGDQIFTDIWGANRVGLCSVLTVPFTYREEIQIVLKRILEKPFLFYYHKKKRSHPL